jgi:hypothetical protein
LPRKLAGRVESLRIPGCRSAVNAVEIRRVAGCLGSQTRHFQRLPASLDLLTGMASKMVI